MSNVNTVKIAPIELLIQFGLNFDKIKKLVSLDENESNIKSRMKVE